MSTSPSAELQYISYPLFDSFQLLAGKCAHASIEPLFGNSADLIGHSNYVTAAALNRHKKRRTGLRGTR